MKKGSGDLEGKGLDSVGEWRLRREVENEGGVD